MPELPEVETVRLALESTLIGPTILDVEISGLNMRRPLNAERLRRGLRGHVFLRWRRRGKYLIGDLAGNGERDRGGSLLIHLGMSGRVQVCEASTWQEKHTHVVLKIDNGQELRYVDPRRFGFVVWLDVGEEAQDPWFLKSIEIG